MQTSEYLHTLLRPRRFAASPAESMHAQIPPFLLCSADLCRLDGPMFFVRRSARIRSEHVHFSDQPQLRE